MNRNRRILKCVRTYEDYNREEILSNNVGIEIQDFTDPNLPEAEINKIVDFYKREFKDLDVIKSMHGPFLDLNPSSPDFEIKRLSYNRYLKALKIAEELEMDYIIYHSQIKEEHIQPAMKEYIIKSNESLWKGLLEQVPNFKGKIVIENIFEKTPELLEILINAVKLDSVGINLDIGHAKLGRVELERWIKDLKDNIIYMHIHSNNGEFDEHLPAPREEIEKLYELLDKYEIDPILSLEYGIENLKEELKKYE